jgi:hypothetical protein
MFSRRLYGSKRKTNTKSKSTTTTSSFIPDTLREAVIQTGFAKSDEQLGNETIIKLLREIDNVLVENTKLIGGILPCRKLFRNLGSNIGCNPIRRKIIELKIMFLPNTGTIGKYIKKLIDGKNKYIQTKKIDILTSVKEFCITYNDYLQKYVEGTAHFEKEMNENFWNGDETCLTTLLRLYDSKKNSSRKGSSSGGRNKTSKRSMSKTI